MYSVPTMTQLQEHARKLYDFCEYPAVRYKITYHYLGAAYDSPELCALRPAFLHSDIVQELYDAQSSHGDWGPLFNKDYSDKTSPFPTTQVAIQRCLRLGLTLDERDILASALDYIAQYLEGRHQDKLYNRNERALPWQLAELAYIVELLHPDNPLCDAIYDQWLYICNMAFADGTYSYERDAAAQHDILFTREKRLVPLPVFLLHSRRERVPEALEIAMLPHFGKHGYENGFLWCKPVTEYPPVFQHKHTRRWFPTYHYINQFQGSAEYLHEAVDWLMQQQNENGLWDYGPQTKDPWGYMGYFSKTRQYPHNRVVDCTLEVLDFLLEYIHRNTIQPAAALHPLFTTPAFPTPGSQ